VFACPAEEIEALSRAANVAAASGLRAPESSDGGHDDVIDAAVAAPVFAVCAGLHDTTPPVPC